MFLESFLLEQILNFVEYSTLRFQNYRILYQISTQFYKTSLKMSIYVSINLDNFADKYENPLKNFV